MTKFDNKSMFGVKTSRNPQTENFAKHQEFAIKTDKMACKLREIKLILGLKIVYLLDNNLMLYATI